MKVFILEDEVSCGPIIEWIAYSFDVVHAKTIEDAAYYLEYEGENIQCSKFIFDASVPAATVIHMDGEEETFNGELNGIDFMISCIHQMELDRPGNKIAVLTAFDLQVKNYPIPENMKEKIEIISKNDNDLVKLLQNFLELNEEDDS